MPGLPPQLQQLIAGGGGVGGAAPPSPQAPPSPPTGAPMATPQPARGEQQSAAVTIGLAMDLLERTLPAFGSESDEGGAILTALSTLSKKFGSARSKGQDLIPAELQQLMSALKPGPVAGAMAGGAPGGMPPGMPPPMPGRPPGMPPPPQ